MTLIAPSTLLESSAGLRRLELEIGGRTLCGSNFRRDAQGSVMIKDLRLSPSEGSGAAWLEADEATIDRDLESIRGAGKVRVGFGGVVVEARSFVIDTRSQRLTLQAVVLRLRDPLCRLHAEELIAEYELVDDGPVVRSFEIKGGVSGSLHLPWRGECRKVDLNAASLGFRCVGEVISVDLRRDAETPLLLRSRDGLIDVSSEGGRLIIDAEGIRFGGSITGTARLSGSSALDPLSRVVFHVTGASGFQVSGATASEPCWWSGESNRCAYDRMTIDEASCGKRSLGGQLALRDPGFATES